MLDAERRKRDGERVALAGAPARPTLDQLRARGRDDDDRHVRRPADEVLHEVEEIVVRPVQILDEEHERRPFREGLEEARPRGERLPALITLLLFRLVGESDQRP